MTALYRLSSFRCLSVCSGDQRCSVPSDSRQSKPAAAVSGERRSLSAPGEMVRDLLQRGGSVTLSDLCQSEHCGALQAPLKLFLLPLNQFTKSSNVNCGHMACLRMIPEAFLYGACSRLLLHSWALRREFRLLRIFSSISELKSKFWERNQNSHKNSIIVWKKTSEFWVSTQNWEKILILYK